MEEKKELNLDNPIFVYYFDPSGMSKQIAEQYIRNIDKSFKIYSNITVLILATHNVETRMECIYPGKGIVSSLDNNFAIFTKTIIELVNNKEYDKLKSFLRSFKLENILQ